MKCSWLQFFWFLGSEIFLIKILSCLEVKSSWLQFWIAWKWNVPDYNFVVPESEMFLITILRCLEIKCSWLQVWVFLMWSVPDYNFGLSGCDMFLIKFWAACKWNASDHNFWLAWKWNIPNYNFWLPGIEMFQIVLPGSEMLLITILGWLKVKCSWLKYIVEVTKQLSTEPR